MKPQNKHQAAALAKFQNLSRTQLVSILLLTFLSVAPSEGFILNSHRLLTLKSPRNAVEMCNGFKSSLYNFDVICARLSTYQRRNSSRGLRKSKNLIACNANDMNQMDEKVALSSNNLLREDQIKATQLFAHQVQISLQDIQQVLRIDSDNSNSKNSYTHDSLTKPSSFVSFRLQGAKSPRIRKISTITEAQRLEVEAQKERLRGCIREVQGRLIWLDSKKARKRRKKQKPRENESISGKNDFDRSKSSTSNICRSLYVQVTIKYHGATDVAQNWKIFSEDNGHEDADIINVEQRLQHMLMPVIGEGDTIDDSTAVDYLASEWGKVETIASSPDLGFQSGELITTSGTWQLDMGVEGRPRSGQGKTRTKKKKASCRFLKNNQTPKDNMTASNAANNNEISLPLSHDQSKNFLISSSSAFFQKLGVVSANGKPKAGMSSKLRQCQRFVEIVGRMVNDYISTCGSTYTTTATADATKKKDNKPRLTTVDMGCGRGYLTFALHSYFMDQFSDIFDVQSRGVDMRPKLVDEINGIAQDLGGDFDSLKFAQGTIENALLLSPGFCKNDSVDHLNDTNVKDQSNDIDILIALHACDTATDDSIWYGIQRKSKIIVTAPCCHKQVRQYLDPHVAKMKLDHPLADVLRHNIYKERMAETVTDSIRALLLEIANYNVQVFEFIGGEHTSKNVMITATKRQKPRPESERSALRQRLVSLANLHGINQQKLAEHMGETLLLGEASVAVGKKRGLSRKRMPPLTKDFFE